MLRFMVVLLLFAEAHSTTYVYPLSGSTTEPIAHSHFGYNPCNSGSGTSWAVYTKIEFASATTVDRAEFRTGNSFPRPSYFGVSYNVIVRSGSATGSIVVQGTTSFSVLPSPTTYFGADFTSTTLSAGTYYFGLEFPACLNEEFSVSLSIMANAEIVEFVDDSQNGGETGSALQARLRLGATPAGGNGDPHFVLFHPISGVEQYKPMLPADGFYSLMSTADLQVNALIRTMIVEEMKDPVQLMTQIGIATTTVDKKKNADNNNNNNNNNNNKTVTTRVLVGRGRGEVDVNGVATVGPQVQVGGVVVQHERRDNSLVVTVSIGAHYVLTLKGHWSFMGHEVAYFDVQFDRVQARNATGLVGFPYRPSEKVNTARAISHVKMNQKRKETTDFLAPGTPEEYLVKGPHAVPQKNGLFTLSK